MNKLLIIATVATTLFFGQAAIADSGHGSEGYTNYNSHGGNGGGGGNGSGGNAGGGNGGGGNGGGYNGGNHRPSQHCHRERDRRGWYKFCHSHRGGLHNRRGEHSRPGGR